MEPLFSLDTQIGAVSLAGWSRFYEPKRKKVSNRKIKERNVKRKNIN
jgi:hypothetical protein